MRKIKRLCGLFICCCVVVTSSVTAFAAEKVKEPFANLEVVTDKETINEIVSENPRMTDVEIITECEFVKAWNDRFYPLNRL